MIIFGAVIFEVIEADGSKIVNLGLIFFIAKMFATSRARQVNSCYILKWKYFESVVSRIIAAYSCYVKTFYAICLDYI